MGRKHKEEGHPNHERWLITYSDLITLLMIFFIVMYSMSKVDAAKFRAVAESLSVTLGGGSASKIDLATSPSGPSIIDSGSNSQVPGQSSKPPVNPQMDKPESTPSEGNGKNDLENLTIEGVKAKLDQFAFENNIQTKLVSSIEERGLVVSIQDTLLFASGSAEITPAARNILKKISTVLTASSNYIKVEGHTDNLPIHTGKFPSNWELSVLRATNVVQILTTEGGIDSQRLSATGYGEYRPIADNKTELGRAANRRVDLVILRSKYELVEPGAKSP
ncbi:MAG: flagellar motor protein MotB [Peptococcaceae bacterium]|nr:flagellar motor protein MotB [Peptococcaceae bacterium]